MKKTGPALVALTTALALGMTACGSDDDSDGADDTTTVTETGDAGASGDGDSSAGTSSAPSSSGAAGPTDPKEVLAAIEAAEKKAGGTAYEVDDQDADGTWEVDVAKGSKSIEVRVTEDGTATLGEEDELNDDDDRAGIKAAKITLGDAIETGLKEVDGTFDDAGLETQNGKHFWEVTVDGANNDEREVAIDVTTGKVLPGVGGDDGDDGDDSTDDDTDDTNDDDS